MADSELDTSGLAGLSIMYAARRLGNFEPLLAYLRAVPLDHEVRVYLLTLVERLARKSPPKKRAARRTAGEALLKLEEIQEELLNPKMCSGEYPLYDVYVKMARRRGIVADPMIKGDRTKLASAVLCELWKITPATLNKLLYGKSSTAKVSQMTSED